MDDRLKQDALIEDALKSYPLAPMPRDITMNVMARIQKDTRPVLVTWSDLVLSFVIAACVAALWFATQNLPPILLAKIRIQGILLYQDFLVNSRWLIPATMLGLAALLAVLSIPAMVQITMKRR
jgi:hypothetical protein